MVKIRRPIFLTGENPGMTLYQPGTNRPLIVASYWVCTDSEWGVGRALVLPIPGEVKVTASPDGTIRSSAFLALAETWVGPLPQQG